MTASELVDIIELRITGGVPTQDGNVFREDIFAYIPVAMSKALELAQQRQLQERRLALREGLSAIASIPYTTKQIVFNREGDYLVGEVVVVSAVGILPIEAVGGFIPAGSRAGAIGVSYPMPYWFYENKKVYVGGLTAKQCTFSVTGLFSDGNIPEALLYDIVEISCDHFGQQLGRPGDDRLSNTDANQERQ